MVSVVASCGEGWWFESSRWWHHTVLAVLCTFYPKNKNSRTQPGKDGTCVHVVQSSYQDLLLHVFTVRERVGWLVG